MEEHLSNLFHRNPWVELLIERGLKILLILAFVVACAKLIHVICTRALTVAHKVGGDGDRLAPEREKRLKTVMQLLDTTLRVLLYSLAFLMVLRECGLDITPFLTGAGIAGVAVGFGAQSLVRDVISGFFLLVEDQIRVGDVIKINGGVSGAVEGMALRTTAVRDGEGTLHIIPNGEIKLVSNMTYEFGQAVVDVPLPYAADLKKVSEVLAGVARDFEKDPRWKGELRGVADFLGVTAFKPEYMNVELAVKTEPHSRWAVSRELHRRVKLALDDSGIALSASVLKPPTSRTS